MLRLASLSLTNWMAWAIAILAAVAVLRLKVPSVWLVVGGGLLGYLFHFLMGVP